MRKMLQIIKKFWEERINNWIRKKDAELEYFLKKEESSYYSFSHPFSLNQLLQLER